MSDVRAASDREQEFPPVLFVFQGTLDQGQQVIHERWPEARAIADSSLDLYRAFGVGRGGLGQLFGPGVWRAGLRALRKGNGQGVPIGDPWIMPGAFLVDGDRVTWRHGFAHAGDHPDFATVANIAEETRRARAPVAGGNDR